MDETAEVHHLTGVTTQGGKMLHTLRNLDKNRPR